MHHTKGRPLILDLCCCAGLASIGYNQAGFDVVGVDIAPQPRYPFTFLHADALDILADVAFCRQFDAIHASPPCQNSSRSTAPHRALGKVYVDLIDPVREALDIIGRPYVMENVPEARHLRADMVLFGYNFDLKVLRRRHFEFGNWMALTNHMAPRLGTVQAGDYCSIYGNQGYRKSSKMAPGWRPKFDQGSGIKTWHYAMGIPPQFKFKDVEIAEGLPPAYTRYIGGLLIDFLTNNNAFL